MCEKRAKAGTHQRNVSGERCQGGRIAKALAPTASLVDQALRVPTATWDHRGQWPSLFLLLYAPPPPEMAPSHAGRESMFMGIYRAPSPVPVTSTHPASASQAPNEGMCPCPHFSGGDTGATCLRRGHILRM